jgi:hypothetical protein
MATKTKLAKEKIAKGNIEDIIDQDPKRSRVAYLSEVGYDTEYFDRPDSKAAYDNAVEYLARDKSITGILVDGAMTRLDRPQFLNSQFTYWDKSEDECREATEAIKNRDQYMNMMLTQLGIVEDRLKELRQRVPHAEKIVLSIHSEDVQHTASAMLNEMIIRRQSNIGDSINKLKSKKNELKKKRTAFEKDFKNIETVRGKSKERRSLKGKIDTCTRKVDRIETKLTDMYDEQQLYREKMVRPFPQYTTNEFLGHIFTLYKTMCDRHGVELVTSEDKLVFDDHLVIDYAHSRHNTWHPVKNREKKLVKEVHGKMRKLKGIDVVLESGHFGVGYKQLQKLGDSPEETNFENPSYTGTVCDDHVTIVMATPFENQAAIAEYVKGRKAMRMSGGKPMNTRKIAATDRYRNGSVSALTIIDKDEKGIVSTEWIEYGKFIDGSALDQSAEYAIIAASADEHLRSPEARPIITDGWVEWMKRLVVEGTDFRGKRSFAKGYINGGDIGEANSRKWRHLYHHKRQPEDMMRENLEMFAGFDPTNIDDLVAMAIRKTNDGMGGSVESMDDIMDTVADYLEKMLDPLLANSEMQHVMAVTTGNHSDNVLQDMGLRETNFFRQRLKAKGMGTYQVGMPGYLQDRKTSRVVLGGYSNARIFQIPDYGLDTEGNPLFGPISVVVQHDPKGSGMNGIIGAGKNAGADLAIAGHTHDNVMKLYKTDENRFGVAYKLATLQGVSPTEKYYASSVPRTQAAHEIVMPAPGDFSEKAIPVSHLRDEGMRALYLKAEQEISKKKK